MIKMINRMERNMGYEKALNIIENVNKAVKGKVLLFPRYLWQYLPRGIYLWKIFPV